MMTRAARNGTLWTVVALAAAAAFFVWKSSVKGDAEGKPVADSPVAAPESSQPAPLTEAPGSPPPSPAELHVRPAMEGPKNSFYEARRGELLGQVAEMREAGMGSADPAMRDAVQKLQMLEADPVSKRPPEGMVQTDLIGLHLFDGPPVKVWTVADTADPAWMMILPGDEILAVDGQDLSGAALADVLAAITNGDGEFITLTIRSSPDSAPRECRIHREGQPQGAVDAAPED